MLETNGFKLKRHTTHLFYIRDLTTTKQRIVLPSTPSNDNSYKKIYSRFKRYEIERLNLK